jgi:hypothetical protein
MLNATPGTVFVLYHRIFRPGVNNPNLEALEPLAGKLLHTRMSLGSHEGHC